MGYRKFKADQLFTGNGFAPQGSVLVTDEKGLIEAIIPQEEAGSDINELRGILSPGFINCHCHLELSHLKGVVPPGTGMVPFLLAIMSQRNNKPHQIADAIAQAESEMLSSGIVAVGDICNTDHTINHKLRGGMYYRNFIEVSGFTGAAAGVRFQNAIALLKALKPTGPSAIVPHAPYSVSPELFELVAEQSAGQIITMHNQESQAENEFFQSGNSEMRKLYAAIGVDLSFFSPPGCSSLQAVLQWLDRSASTILVHNVLTSQEDIDSLVKKGLMNRTIFCLCPNANQYINGSLPPVDLFLENNTEIVLGTDSLASNHQLSIYEEIKTILKGFPQLTLETALQWATINGARALGIEDRYGSFEKGKQPGLVQIYETRHTSYSSLIVV